ncbi:hypothetical protein CRG98_015598 [Punica granatum]|uniref:Uncharacterized protein n=1 Tax=Punica granatum TaxID=22663 RepID=A0A2I0K628_PUNGR|nr:hypothetical protein CRG98_015598 [Punica granatum]
MHLGGPRLAPSSKVGSISNMSPMISPTVFDIIVDLRIAIVAGHLRNWQRAAFILPLSPASFHRPIRFQTSPLIFLPPLRNLACPPLPVHIQCACLLPPSLSYSVFHHSNSTVRFRTLPPTSFSPGPALCTASDARPALSITVVLHPASLPLMNGHIPT